MKLSRFSSPGSTATTSECHSDYEVWKKTPTVSGNNKIILQIKNGQRNIHLSVKYSKCKTDADKSKSW